MIKIRLIFILIFVLFILPFVKYFQLKGQEERILKEGISRVYTQKEFTTPRRKILDRNSIELATDIRRDTFIFSNCLEYFPRSRRFLEEIGCLSISDLSFIITSRSCLF